MIQKDLLIKRFVSYVTIDTQSDENSSTTPSTQEQWDLAHKLHQELLDMGLSEVSIDDNGYICLLYTSPSPRD